MKTHILQVLGTLLISAATAATITIQMQPKAQAQAPNKLPVSQRPLTNITLKQQPGGSVVVPLGYGIEVNKGSTLQRAWYVIEDESAPVLIQNAGVKPIYKSESYGGRYHMIASGSLAFSREVTALEVRFMIFDIWGRHIQTLSGTQVKDFSTKTLLDLSSIWSWDTYENQVSEYLTSVAFLARARYPDGTVWTFNPDAVFDKVKAITSELTKDELTPEKRKPATK